MTATVLAVWTRQPLATHSLTGRERDRLAELPQRARREWLVSRHALRVLLGVLGLPRDTTGYAFPHRRLSLTHIEGAAVAAGAVRPVPRLAGIGVDLEADRPVQVDTARFFLDEHERSWLASLPERARPTEQLRLWTVKEALFKADPDNRHTVLLDYSTLDASARRGRARARQHGEPLFGYASARLRGAHLSIAAAFHGETRTAQPIAPERQTPVPTAVTFDEVADRISTTLSIPVEKLTPQTTLRELAADSFLLVEMAVDLQEEFDTIFTQDELREITTLGELAGLVGAKV
ncbi:4'-phosphopantetheinyl transferase superfamily protein [Streptantibioticus rubrisoli]|uniref:Phosphopantetheine-binding protein n=1 Tax=Streptantibioticus rubrisoli TaxID=1387313 RepID=A0ABT1P8M9_9ACTN|nr:4'-phosphopantetheinyl transferase superfamily protein [Streptantibioticus rubrisoli]MCQ4040710.1 phosphopantetheine-binding protein [Streptantibioticus rubrisoli]